MEGKMSDEIAPATPETTEDELRKHALDRLHAKRGFQASLVAYVCVNALLVLIWALTKDDGDGFWPVWVIGFWGLGLIIQGWNAYGWHRKPISDDDVNREIEKLKS
jgi:2TM domain